MILDLILFKDPSVKRHVAKTITWRIVGTLDTMVIGWLITGNPITGLKIGGIEMFTKMILYFIHERIWFKLNLGLPHRLDKQKKVRKQLNQLKSQNYQIGRKDFEKRNKHRGIALWFTGLSGSGKST